MNEKDLRIAMRAAKQILWREADEKFKKFHEAKAQVIYDEAIRAVQPFRTRPAELAIDSEQAVVNARVAQDVREMFALDALDVETVTPHLATLIPGYRRLGG